ncbi:MAG: 3'(2'),5'-bisphosphate nucleotidase CysQ [Burkholderiaceae bacterium]
MVSLSHPDWRDHLDGLIAIASEAGNVARSLFEAQARGEDVGRRVKADSSPLTEADRRAHQIICDGLARLTPGLFVVSEEDAPEPAEGQSGRGAAAIEGRADRTADDRFWWLVDPLDGTREFVSGHPEFTINIALMLADRPVFGIVSTPMLGSHHWGAPGKGAWMEDAQGRRQIRCAALPSRSANGDFQRPLRILASRQHLTPATEAWIAGQQPHELHRYGSSLKFCRIAEGQGDCYPRLGPTAPWDTAAAQAVVEGAGGHVVIAGGLPLRYDGSRALNPHFLVLGDSSLCERPPALPP